MTGVTGLVYPGKSKTLFGRVGRQQEQALRVRMGKQFDINDKKKKKKLGSLATSRVSRRLFPHTTWTGL